MADETFGINNQNPAQPEPQPTINPTTPAEPQPIQPVQPETLTTMNPPTSETPPLDIDKELEKQLSEVPTTEKTSKKFPIKIVAIILVILLAGGVGAYFFLGMNSSENVETEIVNDPPPSFPNPFAEEETETPEEEESIVELETPDSPPSLTFPSEEFAETIDELKENSEVSAEVTETPTMEDFTTEEETVTEEDPLVEEETPSQKISR